MTTQKIVLTKDTLTKWKNDPFTQEVLVNIKQLRASIQESMLDEDLILNPNGQIRLARLLGQREGLDLLLNIHHEEDDEYES